jgi:hypothetical protein
MIDLLNFFKYIANFFFFALVVLGSSRVRQSPNEVILLAICLIIFGVPLAVNGFRKMEKYREIFDYEPVPFWNKTRNGKQAREALMSVSVIGLGCTLAGLVLVTVVVFKIQIIPVII